MKAITLHQPWAQLIAVGAKKIETRSWATRHRGPLAIHAGKGAPSILATTAQWQTIMAELDRAGVSPLDLPRGAIVAVCDLVIVSVIGGKPRGPEVHFGDYTPGRYAWHLDNVRALAEPIPMRGKQGLWNVDDAAIATAAANAEAR